MGIAVATKQNSCSDLTAVVQAQALPGYEFVKWSDGFTDNPHTIFVTSDTTITAEFRKVGTPEEDSVYDFIVESADETRGDVIITITAQAIEGFEFSHWSDGNTENPRVITLDKDVELYAYFVQKSTVGVEISEITSAQVYTKSGVLYVKGSEDDYYLLDAAGRLVYSGRDAMLSLPRGVYLISIAGKVQKVVI